MRKIVAPVLLGLGGFLIVAALVATFWAPGVVEKTPAEVDNTTYLSGEASRLGAEARPIKVTSITKSDTDAVDDEVIPFVNRSCVVFNDEGDTPDCVDGKDPRLVTASVDVFATDRVTAIAVNDEKYLPSDAVPHEGLVNKWPFDSQKKTYPYWDGTTGQAVDAEYVGEETLEGLDTYHYQITIDEAEIEIAEDTPGTYSNVIDIFVEPRTGAIVDQRQDQQRFLEDGTQVLDLQAAFTDEQVKKSVKEAEDSVALLDLITRTVPLVGFIGGGVFLIAGVLLLLAQRRKSTPPPVVRERETVGAR